MDEEIEGWITVERTGDSVEIDCAGILNCLILADAESLWRKLGESLGKDAGKEQG